MRRAGSVAVVVVAVIWASLGGRVRPAPASPGGAPAAAPDAGPGWALRTSQCTACHEPVAGLSHPVGAAPSMRIPADFPLDERGHVTCLTCHDLIDPAAHERARRERDPALRRGLSGEQLCAACHGGEPGNDRAARHRIGAGRAHLGWTDAPRDAGDRRPHATAKVRPSRAAGLDLDTRTCLTCHDGMLAGEAAGGSAHGTRLVAAAGAPLAGAGVVGLTGLGGEDHPVGIPYADRPERRGGRPSEMPLRPAHLLDPRVQLPDGQVGCTSCHSPYSTERALLVMPNRGSGLCLECHGG